MARRLVTLGVFGLALACTGEGSRTGPAAEGWALEAEPLVSIGVADGEEPYLFDRITAVRVLPDGRIVVADAGSASVRVFDADGAFERQIGRRGEGPGEFAYLTSLRVEGPDTLVTYDARNLRLSWFLASGELLESRRLRTDRGSPDYLGRLSDGSHVLTWLRGGGELGPNPVADSVLFGLFEADSLRSLLGVTAGMRRVAVFGSPGYSGPVPFSPHPLSALLGDTLFHSDGRGGRVEAVTPDRAVVRSFTVPVESWSPEEAAARLEPNLNPGLAECCPRLAELGGAEEIPTLSHMLADSESLLWVKAYDPATDSHAVAGRPRTGGVWWVLETDGRVVARVTMPDGFRPMEIGRDLVAGVARDELDVERVLVYALTRG